MIKAQQLVRRYGDFAAVDNVSFSILPGEVVGLLGHNGAGKTTIMKMLTGYIEPSSGEVLVDGIDVQSQPLAVQAKMGYLPESLPIYPELTVADYLAHTAQLRGLDPQLVVPDALASTQLTDKALERIDTLSRGYKQRLGVAQAILHKPKFLILDEPSNGLDPNQIQHMRALIRSLAQDATVILSTHIMQEVSAVCDRALIVRGGKLVVDERLADLQRATEARLISTESAAVEPILRGLACVQKITSMGGGVWTIGLQGGVSDAISAVAVALVGGEIPIFSLAPEIRDLEAIFAEVNLTEELVDAA